MRRLSLTLLIVLILGYTYLYLPILITIVNSFNASRLMTRWDGFSVRWYLTLFEDEDLIRAFWLSIKIACSSATIAVIIGVLAGYSLSRLKSLKSYPFFSSLMAAPLVMPEVILGLAFLLTFITFESVFGWPKGRGFLTILISHATIAIAYVAIVIKTRLDQFDASVEEAAMDLGCRPVKVFFVITIPIILPAIIVGWLLAFTLSLDDVVVASFTSGPSATTLPMVVFSNVRFNLTPEINALAAILILFFASILGIGFLFVKKFKK